MRDRGFFLIFAPVTALAFVLMVVSEFTYAGLIVGMLLAMLASRFVLAAYQELIALVGREKLMSGRPSALWNVVRGAPVVAGTFASGFVSGYLAPTQALFLAAAVTSLIAAIDL